MPSKWFSLTLVVTIISYFITLTQSTPSTTTSSSPNIIYIIMDDMGYGDISALGGEFTTPNFDSFYSESIILNSHYIGLVCSPSRSQIITGRYAWNMGVSAQTPYGPQALSAIPAGLPTIADILNEYTNYKSYVTGKWHMGYPTDYHTPMYRGFTGFYGFLGTGIFYTNKTREYHNDHKQYIDWRANYDVDWETQFEFSTYVTRDRILQIINNHTINYNDKNSDLSEISDNITDISDKNAKNHKNSKINNNIYDKSVNNDRNSKIGDNNSDVSVRMGGNGKIGHNIIDKSGQSVKNDRNSNMSDNDSDNSVKTGRIANNIANSHDKKVKNNRNGKISDKMNGLSGEGDVYPFFIYAPFQAPHNDLQSVSSTNGDNCNDIDTSTHPGQNRFLYCQNIMAMDDVLGDIIESLKTNRLWNNTIIVFTSDNGGSYKAGGCNYPLRGNKMNFYEGGIRAITLVGGGYIAPDQRGTERNGFIHGSDWLPTFLGIIGDSNNDKQFVTQISNNLQHKLYIPMAKQLAMKLDNNNTIATNNYLNYLVNNSFDGTDVSQWLLYGNESDNSAKRVGLSINTIEQNATNDVSIVFVSELTGHRYKFMYLASAPSDTEWCYYSENKRKEIASTVNETKLLYDMTLDANETTNLMDSLSLSKYIHSIVESRDRNEANSEKSGQNSKHSQTSHKNSENNRNNGQNSAKNSQNSENNSQNNENSRNNGRNSENSENSDKSDSFRLIAPSVEYARAMVGKYRNKVENKMNKMNVWSDLSSLGNYTENSELVLYLWYDAQVIVYEYENNAMFNNYLGCQDENAFAVEVNPTLHGDAWGPYLDFDNYKSNLTSLCDGQINDVLLEFYLSIYDDYAN